MGLTDTSSEHSDQSDCELTRRLLDHLPVELTMRREGDGRLIYSNAAAALCASGDYRPHRETLKRIVEIDGRSYEVSTIVDISEQCRLEDELAKLAFFDELTGLAKTVLMQRTVDNLITEGGAPFALSFIDVDNFKFINDYYGHDVGDQLLKKIAQRISADARPSDLLARVGGDEFVFLTAPVGSFVEVGPEIERLSARFKDPFYIGGLEIFTSASIGVSLYPRHGETYEVLRANADSAMYRIKGTAKGGVRLFDAEMHRAATARMESEQRLRGAIRDRKICCAFQPKIDFRSDEIIGLEVLLRWRDENDIIRPPGDFIKLAIELGLMDDVTMIILDQVIDQIDLINDAFGPNATISLNVAAAQGGDLGFMVKLAEAIRDSGYPSRFILELTEEAFIAKGAFQNHVLPMLKELDIGVSIDDFGVGYSSLSALAEITADELKIDRSFITDIHKKPRNQSILKVIETLANSLDMRVVVEGVETSEELAYIQACTRISCAQGFYFAKPMLLQGLSNSVHLESRPGRAGRGAHSRSLKTSRR